MDYTEKSKKQLISSSFLIGLGDLPAGLLDRLSQSNRDALGALESGLILDRPIPNATGIRKEKLSAWFSAETSTSIGCLSMLKHVEDPLISISNCFITDAHAHPSALFCKHQQFNTE